jgi:hypothetical protein
MSILTLTVKLLFDQSPMAGDKWKGTIEIESSSTLADLHSAIQDAVEFEDDHLFEFYIAKSPRAYNDRIRFIGYDDDFSDDEYGSIFDTKISDIFPLETGKKFFYWFDFGDNWMFEISKGRKADKDPVKGEEYPRLVDEKGVKPVQYPDYDDEDIDEE